MVAGGHAAFNPEPIADFIDAAVLGDGEQAVLEITDIVRELKARGKPGWARTSCCSGSRRPAASTSREFYDVEYLDDGRIKRVVPQPRTACRGG